ncbi:MAG TPA: TIGR03619 family F420-dependent LLM class oxidoreductase [Acetobacteraceae bacterium]|nr:TIGR03619 family F420-dependent LLM class oxidoreductase [Acetobacteraceae bacterium]
MTRKIAVGIGLAELPFATGGGFWRWIDLCEQGGIDSFWQTDRLVSRHPILECLSALAAVAGRTRRMKLGMNVLSLAMREPLLVAKQCATIDVLSEGRMLPGFGIGSPLAPEWAAMELDTRTRGARTDEALEVIRRLWNGERLDYEGRFFRFRGAAIAPRPVQTELPMWIGGGTEAAIRRTARYGTGWQAGPETPEQAGAVVAAIRRAVAEAGRGIDEDHYGAGIPFRFGRADDPALAPAYDAYRARTRRDPAGYFAVGDAVVIRERLAEYIRAGLSKFILRPIGRGEDEIMAQTGRLIAEILPWVAEEAPKLAA